MVSGPAWANQRVVTPETAPETREVVSRIDPDRYRGSHGGLVNDYVPSGRALHASEAHYFIFYEMLQLLLHHKH